MSSIVVSGDTSGSITIAAPAVAGTNTLTLPALTGTVLTTATPGSVLQILNTTFNTGVTTDSSSYTDTGLSLSITPSKSTSKILVIATGFFVGGTSSTWCFGQLVRNSTAICLGTGATHNCTWGVAGSQAINSGATISYLDSPATTSAVTYKIQFKSGDGSGYPVGFNRRTDDLYYDGCSAITLMEIAA